MDNSGFIGGGVDFNDMFRAIQAAPPDTWLDFTNIKAPQWMRCTDCGAEMDEVLTQYHACEAAK